MTKTVVLLILALTAADVFAVDIIRTVDNYPSCGAELVPAEPPSERHAHLRYRVTFRPDRPVRNLQVLTWGQKSAGGPDLDPDDFQRFGNRFTPDDEGGGTYSFYHSVYNTQWPQGVFYIFYDMGARKMLGAIQVVRDLSQEPDPNRPYTGDGGKGLTLGILEPAGKNLGNDERWILPLIQASLTGSFQKYSAITVIERQNFEQVLREQELNAGGYFSDDDYIRMGHMTSARYILTGSLTAVHEGYVLELAIIDAEKGERRASFPPRLCDADDLYTMTVVQRAAIELLEQMGVALTGAGRNGILAEYPVFPRDTAVRRVSPPAETLTAGRISALARDVSGGNAGGTIHTTIQRREAFKTLLEDSVRFYNERPYFDVVYNTKPEQGSINYRTGKVEIGYSLWLSPNAEFDTLQEIIRASLAAGKIKEWDLNDLYTELLLSRSAGGGFRDYYFKLEAELLDDTGAFLSNGTVDLIARWDNDWPAGRKLTILSRNKLKFIVPVDELTENLKLDFVFAGKKLWRPRLSSFEVTDTPNMLNNTHITATEKTFEQFFGDRDFRRKRVELFVPSYDAPSAIFPVITGSR